MHVSKFSVLCICSSRHTVGKGSNDEKERIQGIVRMERTGKKKESLHPASDTLKQVKFPSRLQSCGWE